MSVRMDGREPDDLRPVEFLRDFTEFAAGSVLIRMGRTAVLCTASVADDVPRWMRNTGRGWVDLGGYVKQISAGLVSAFPQSNPSVFAIGLNDGLWSNTGSGWVGLGSYVTEVSGPTAGNAGINLPAGLVYGVTNGHGAFLRNGTSFVSIAGGTAE